MKTVFYGILCGMILFAGMQGVFYYNKHPALFVTFEVGDIWCEEIEEEDVNPYLDEIEIPECGKIISMKNGWIEWASPEKMEDSLYYLPQYYDEDYFIFRFGTKQ